MTSSQISNANVIWQDDGTPYSPDFEDVYFSREGGLEETHHVFLEGNDLLLRWQRLDAELAERQTSGVFTIVELGFGTALNFLCTWRLWQKAACKYLRLHYISCEKHPMTHADLARALALWPQLAVWRDALLPHYPDHTAGYHRLPLAAPAPDGSHSPVTLDLYYGDALQCLNEQANPEAQVDAWYLDGFTPSRNMDLWSEELLQLLATRTRSGGTLASYSVTGRVVRELRSHGFTIEKRPGFGSKREMLTARKISSGAASADTSAGTGVATDVETTAEAADQTTKPTATPPRALRRALVIGAGLAGATTARALALRGVHVTVLEQQSTVAAGASGNPQAVVQMRLNRQADALSDFNLHSYLYALRFYNQLARTEDNRIQWHPCGVLTLDSAYTHTRRRPQPGDYGHYSTQLLRRMSPAEVHERSGVNVTDGATLQPQGGWLNPEACTRACLQHPQITVRTGQQVARLQRVQPHPGTPASAGPTGATSNVAAQPVWQALGVDDQVLAEAEAVFLCTSFAVRQFAQAGSLPVYPLRGQISYLAATGPSKDLDIVLCGERYIAPAVDGTHCIGASYVKYPEPQTGTLPLSLTEHQENLSRLGTPAEQFGFASDPAPPLRGRASLRGSSADYMPLGGALSAVESGAGADPAGQPVEGLYVSAGHGSHGTTTCPLIAEHLAALACGEFSPFTASTAACIDPMRFEARRRRREEKQQPQRTPINY